jgi:lysophospholipase L1-like esterase
MAPTTITRRPMRALALCAGAALLLLAGQAAAADAVAAKPAATPKPAVAAAAAAGKGATVPPAARLRRRRPVSPEAAAAKKEKENAAKAAAAAAVAANNKPASPKEKKNAPVAAPAKNVKPAAPNAPAPAKNNNNNKPAAPNAPNAPAKNAVAPAPAPAAATPSSLPTSPIRILAVGDSVAKGSLPSLGFNHPFTIELARSLPGKLGIAEAIADTDGIVGCAGFFRPGCEWRVDLLTSTKRVLEKKKAAGVKYDWAVVHGGINDILAEGKTAEQVAERIDEVVGLLLADGMRVVVLPPLAAPAFISPDDPKEAERARLAGVLEAVADRRNKEAAASGKQGPAVLAMGEAVAPGGPLDFWPKRGEMEDGLHLKIPGYDLMGSLVADAIAKAVLQGQA